MKYQSIFSFLKAIVIKMKQSLLKRRYFIRHLVNNIGLKPWDKMKISKIHSKGNTRQILTMKTFSLIDSAFKI